MTKLQFYLIASTNIPTNLWILNEDDSGVDKKFHGKIDEDFEQVLTPLGDDLSNATVTVPEDTKFAGILWGDGEHFDQYITPNWGIVGEIERVGSYHCRIRGADGSVIAEFEDIKNECDDIPHVMPPEAFGLQRKPWWNDTYLWCSS